MALILIWISGVHIGCRYCFSEIKRCLDKEVENSVNGVQLDGVFYTWSLVIKRNSELS